MVNDIIKEVKSTYNKTFNHARVGVRFIYFFFLQLLLKRKPFTKI